MSLLVRHVACPIGQTWLHSDDYVTAKWESVDRLQFFPVTGVWAWVSVGALNLPLGLQFCASLTSWHGLPILFKNLIGQVNVIHTSSQQGHSLVRYCLPEDGDFKRSSKWSWLAGCGVSNAFFCIMCLLLICPGAKLFWTTTGVRGLKHLTENCKRHKSSHLDNCIRLHLFGGFRTVEQLHESCWTGRRKYDEEVTRNQHISV